MVVRRRHASLVTTMVLLFASAGYPQAPTTSQSRPPDFTVQVWGDLVEDFSGRIAGYLDLRTRLEVGLPPLIVTDDPADITTAEVALATRIRVARDDAERGEFFTSAIGREFRRVLRLEMTAATLADIMEENPGVFSHSMNATYSKERVLSTMPANILALLPRLPDDIQYRFLGPHLVLHDTRANVILDRLNCAIRCTD